MFPPLSLPPPPPPPLLLLLLLLLLFLLPPLFNIINLTTKGVWVTTGNLGEPSVLPLRLPFSRVFDFGCDVLGDCHRHDIFAALLGGE
jgi:hypothetical protein